MTGKLPTPDWLLEAPSIVRAIQEVADACEEPYRLKCFELLLNRWLAASPTRIGGQTRSAKPDFTMLPSGDLIDWEGVQRGFLGPAGLTREALDSVLDLDTGEVLVTDLGRTGADIQRRLGGLLALYHFIKEGQFVLRQDELVNKCRRYGGVDTSNFTAYMRSAKFQGAAVFVQEGRDAWRVTKPGERFIADIVRTLSRQQESSTRTTLSIDVPSPAGEEETR